MTKIKIFTLKVILSFFLIEGLTLNSFANFYKNDEFYLGGRLSVNSNKYLANTTIEAQKAIIIDKLEQDKLQEKIEELSSSIDLYNKSILEKKEVISEINSILNGVNRSLDNTQILIILDKIKNSLAGLNPDKEILEALDYTKEILEALNSTKAGLKASANKIKTILESETTLLNQNIAKLSAEKQSLLLALQDKTKALSVGGNGSDSNSKTALNLGLLGGFQTYKDNFVFSSGLELDFGNNKIGSDFSIKNSFSYSFIGRVGYSFDKDTISYISLGFKFAKHDISLSTFNYSKNVKYFVFGLGGEKRISRDLGVFGEVNYATSIGNNIVINQLNSEIKLSTLKFSLGLRYYFEAKSTINKATNLFTRSN